MSNIPAMTRGNKAHELHLQMKLHMDNEKNPKAANQRRSNVFWQNYGN
jgi:hypothetical protein